MKYPAKSFRQRCSVMVDFLKLRRDKGLTMEEYDQFHMIDRPASFRQHFLGVNEQRYYLDLLNPVKYYILARNKYVAHQMLSAAGLPLATLFCYYDPEAGPQQGPQTAHNTEEVLRVLQAQGVTSCVVKTTETSHGSNVQVVTDIDYSQEGLCTFHDGSTCQMSSLLGNKPLMFESRIRQSAQMATFNDSSVNTVRFMTLLFPDGTAEVAATFIKIGRSGRCVDNAGAGGNVDACVDTATGTLQDAICFDGWEKITPVTHHPDSNAPLDGVQIEHWEEICTEVKRFQQAFPFVKAAGWDIAITDNGPVIVEVNDMWDRTGQLFIHRGWRNDIRRCYMAWKNTNAQYEFGRLPNELSPRRLQRIARK